jgi:hypothetical protein
MNYGEEIAYWYLRLNGFFPLTNFVIHRSREVAHTSDCDLLAVRLPYVYEEIGGNPDDWDVSLSEKIGFDHPIGIICEVKTGAYAVKKLFRPEYVKYSIGRLGFTPKDNITDLSKELSVAPMTKITKEGYRIFKLLIAEEKKEAPTYFYKSLEDAEEFIENRVGKYPQNKYADRLFFSSVHFQHTISRINKERKQRGASIQQTALVPVPVKVSLPQAVPLQENDIPPS